MIDLLRALSLNLFSLLGLVRWFILGIFRFRRIQRLGRLKMCEIIIKCHKTSIKCCNLKIRLIIACQVQKKKKKKKVQNKTTMIFETEVLFFWMCFVHRKDMPETEGNYQTKFTTKLEIKIEIKVHFCLLFSKCKTHIMKCALLMTFFCE